MTKWGLGVVTSAKSWREAIAYMDDNEALDFSSRCKIEAGIDYKNNWVELLVVVDGISRRVLGDQVEKVESVNEL